jgi:rhodanese-related sulfurtransferase
MPDSNNLKMQQITAATLKEWMESGKEFLLVDIREEYEREAFNIGGMHIPMGDVHKRMNELPADKPIVLYCEKGIRSTITIQRLERAGLDLYNLSGGMKAWKDLFVQ